MLFYYFIPYQFLMCSSQYWRSFILLTQTLFYRLYTTTRINAHNTCCISMWFHNSLSSCVLPSHFPSAFCCFVFLSPRSDLNYWETPFRTEFHPLTRSFTCFSYFFRYLFDFWSIFIVFFKIQRTFLTIVSNMCCHIFSALKTSQKPSFSVRKLI